MNIPKVKLLLVVLALTVANFATAGNNKVYVAKDNSAESKICVAAATASNLRVNVMVKQFSSTKVMRKKYELVANGINCNGINIADFAEEAGNIEVANKLKSYRTRSVEIQDIAAVRSGFVGVVNK